MPCFKPLRGYQQRSKSKKRPPVVFTPPAVDFDLLDIPCNQCIGCRIDKGKEWALRCVHEASQHEHNQFVTLTYDDEPHGGTLVKKHFQDFMKRLRRSRPGETIRYYMCGEYGDKLSRPHYHACLFNVKFDDKILWKTQNGNKLYASQELNERWGHGFCLVGDVTWESAAYVARYVMKKVNGKLKEKLDHNGLAYYERMDENTGEVYEILPEYATMSLKPAIGKDWFTKYSTDCYPSDFITHKGKKFNIPRYYDKLLEKGENEKYEIIKEKRKETGNKHFDNNSPKRLKARETCLKAKINLLKRPLEENR